MANLHQVNFQDSMSLIAHHLVSFHDFTLLVLTWIIILVGGILGQMHQSTHTAKSNSSHHLLEFIWTLLPALVLVSVAIPSLTLLFMMEDSSEAFISAKITGFQWYWNYEPNLATASPLARDSFMLTSPNTTLDTFRLLDTCSFLASPMQVPVRLLVTSSDVLHAWTVPSLGVKMDACPGRLNEMIALPARTGTFYGQCSEICGSNHSFMPVEVQIVSAPLWSQLLPVKH